MIFAEFMILYCTDSLGCIGNNNRELINIYLYHSVTVITTCFMLFERLLRCPHQSTEEGKPTSLFSLRSECYIGRGRSYFRKTCASCAYCGCC